MVYPPSARSAQTRIGMKQRTVCVAPQGRAPPRLESFGIPFLLRKRVPCLLICASRADLVGNYIFTPIGKKDCDWKYLFHQMEKLIGNFLRMEL